jgi:nitrite reductase/ring-hydroxylating ferredoxin subunit
MSDVTFQQALQHLGALVEEFDQLPYPQVREKVFELLQTVDAVHRTGLQRLVDLLHDDDPADVLERARRDPVVHTLLLLYDLAPEPMPNIDLKVPGSGSSAFVSVDQLTLATQQVAVRRPQPVDVASLESVPPGTLAAFEVGGAHVLVARIDDEVYAVPNQCPGSRAPLHLGSFSPPVVTCPWHNEPYDIRTGVRVDGVDTPRLELLPAAVKDGRIHVVVGAQEDLPGSLR